MDISFTQIRHNMSVKAYKMPYYHRQVYALNKCFKINSNLLKARFNTGECRCFL